MSTVTEGVIGMPFEIAMASEVSRRQFYQVAQALYAENERNQRMLLAASTALGEVGEAMGAEMDDDSDELVGLATELRKEAARYRWFRSTSQLPADKLDDLMDDLIAKAKARESGNA